MAPPSLLYTPCYRYGQRLQRTWRQPAYVSVDPDKSRGSFRLHGVAQLYPFVQSSGLC
jgi:hypothetical protein